MTQKIICIVVASLFLINNIAYGLSPMPGSAQPGTKAGMYALAQKLFAAKSGPGSIYFDSYVSGSFIGSELLDHPDVGVYIEEANGYKTKFVKADYDNPPEAWENNPILKETDLISALKAFRDTEAKISAENLDIREEYFPVDEEKGELPVARIEKVNENKYVLVVHTKFVQMWNHIRKNDVWFEVNLGPNDRRTLSVAWGVFYRLAKHEFTDLKHENLLPKSIGHIMSINGEVVLNKDEITANTIGGNYHLLNDSIWMWFLVAYCFSNTTRYNNERFLQRVNWMFDGRGATELKLDNEFPQLLSDRNNRTLATAFAYAINYNFFNRPDIVVPKTSVDEKFIREYEEREEARKAIGITEKPIYAAGQEQAPAPAKKVTIENLSVATLAEAVTAAIRSDFATKTREKEKVVKLWNNFIKEHAIEGMTVKSADVEETLAAKIKYGKNVTNAGRLLGLTDIIIGVSSVIFSTGLWPFSVVISVIGLAIVITSRWDIEKRKSLARLAGYLEKAKEGLASQTITTVKEEQAPAPAKKVTIENLSVATLAEAVTAAIRSDFATKTQEKEKVIKLWNNFIKEHVIEGMIVKSADVEETFTAEIKFDKDVRTLGILFGFAITIVGIFPVIFSIGLLPLSVVIGVVGLTIVIALGWDIGKEKRLARLAGYLAKAKEGLASQTITTVKEEQAPAPAEEKHDQDTLGSRESLSGEEAVPTVRPIVEEHPLIQLISEYIVRLGLEKGPGAESLSPAELENIYKTVNLLRENNIELFIPQQVKLTEKMQEAIKDMGKKEGGSYIVCRQYSDLRNLAKLLQSPPAGKRIVITDIAKEKEQEEMAQLVAEYSESFRVTRLLNITLPVNYSKMDNIEKTVYQAKIVTIAILARLFEKNKTPIVEMLLRSMIKGCLDVDDEGMNEYFDELGNPNDGQELSREALVKRILFFIGKTIKVVERIGEEIRLLKTFWTAA